MQATINEKTFQVRLGLLTPETCSVVFSVPDEVFRINGKKYTDLEICAHFMDGHQPQLSYSAKNGLTLKARKKIRADYGTACLEYAKQNLQEIMLAE